MFRNHFFLTILECGLQKTIQKVNKELMLSIKQLQSGEQHHDKMTVTQ